MPNRRTTNWPSPAYFQAARHHLSHLFGGKRILGVTLEIKLGFFSQVSVGEESLQRCQDVKGSSSRIDLGDLNPFD